MGKLSRQIFLILGLVSVLALNANAQGLKGGNENEDILLSDPYLSVLYQRGSYMIYNCIDGHWVCSGKAEYEACRETRNIALKENQTKLPCAPIRKFTSEKACNQHQSSLVDAATRNRFCLHPSRSEIEIEY